MSVQPSSFLSARMSVLYPRSGCTIGKRERVGTPLPALVISVHTLETFDVSDVNCLLPFFSVSFCLSLRCVYVPTCTRASAVLCQSDVYVITMQSSHKCMKGWPCLLVHPVTVVTKPVTVPNETVAVTVTALNSHEN
jgi:hypothetical protein